MKFLYKTLVIVNLILLSACQSKKPDMYGKKHSNAPLQVEQWGQLVGDWQCISDDLDMTDKDNPIWYRNKATWKWQYVMGGHAVLNQWWQQDNSPQAKSKERYATGLFVFNPTSSMWEAVVTNSKTHKLSEKFQAQHINNEIKMHDGSGTWLVTFYNIEKNTFKWKYELINPNGERKIISKIEAKRI